MIVWFHISKLPYKVHELILWFNLISCSHLVKKFDRSRFLKQDAVHLLAIFYFFKDHFSILKIL